MPKNSGEADENIQQLINANANTMTKYDNIMPYDWRSARKKFRNMTSIPGNSRTSLKNRKMRNIRSTSKNDKFGKRLGNIYIASDGNDNNMIKPSKQLGPFFQ